MTLTNLNIDCLLVIFSHCSERDLISLCYASNYLRDVINEHIFYAQTKDLLMCGHRNRPCVEQRNQSELTYWERLQVARNWQCGVYLQNSYYHHAQMFPTKLWLERDYLYITRASYLRKYRRSTNEALQRRYDDEISTPIRSDIADFVKDKNTIFVGRVCGSCYVCDSDGDILTEQTLHSAKEYLHCVDFKDDLYVTSSDKCCKLWIRSQEFDLTHFDLQSQFDYGFKTLKLKTDCDWLFGGLYTDLNRRALRGINIVSGAESVLNSNTISIYDLKIKDENVLFTANFDTTFRMYDLRANCDVSIWEDPFDSSFYCLEYDGLYAVLCGAKYHCRVNLYDIRVPGKYVQLYFARPTRQHNSRSPVYSLACDSRFLFVATDHNLRVFDFKTDSGIKRDYSKIYKYNN